MAVTSADVARAAGVSRATVSYVLNDAPGRTLPEATREAVRRAARELGYQPNALATSLKRGRSNTVLFPLPGLTLNQVLHDTFAACSAVLAPRGLSLVLDISHLPDAAAQADAWAGLAPAAVLDLVLRHDDAALAELRRRGVPVLSAAPVGETAWESTGDLFAREQRRAQIRHLTAAGRRRIAWVLPAAWPNAVDPRTEERLMAAAHAEATAAGAVLEPVRLALEDVAGVVAGWSSLPDAVAAHDDTFAVAALAALQRRGVDVPGEVAVIGADDEPIARAVAPGLTTVSGDFGPFAESVGRSVAAVLSGGTAPPLPVPGIRVVRRGSA